MMPDTAVATDGMFPINAAGSTHPINGLVDGATTMTTAPQFSEPTATSDGIVGKVLAAGIAAEGAKIATTAGDKPEGLVATSDAAVHHVTTTAPKGTQVHVAATPEKFSLLEFLDTLEAKEASKALGYVPNSVIAQALVEQPDVTNLLKEKHIDVAALLKGLEVETALEIRAHKKAEVAKHGHERAHFAMPRFRMPFLEEIPSLEVAAVMQNKPVTALKVFEDFVFSLEKEFGRTLDAFKFAGISGEKTFPEVAAAKKAEAQAEDAKRVDESLHSPMTRMLMDELKTGLQEAITQGIVAAGQQHAAPQKPAHGHHTQKVATTTPTFGNQPSAIA